MFFRKLFSLTTLTLLVALVLSAIAAWYSVQGLAAIFAAAVMPIIIMGTSLEVAKVVTTVWLHRYWSRASITLKLYLVPAVMALAFLTSMGIFGFLSKAHSDQTLVSGDVQAQASLIEEKIKTARENIDANKKALQQLDAQVDKTIDRTTDDKGINRSVQIRRQQAPERTKLNKENEEFQKQIIKLNEELAPIRAQSRKVEAEVGPIKYIAALIYGDNPDANLLERAVRWVIILIVCVFDPLALTLVLASQSSYNWLNEDLKKKREEAKEETKEEPEQEKTDVVEQTDVIVPSQPEKDITLDIVIPPVEEAKVEKTEDHLSGLIQEIASELNKIADQKREVPQIIAQAVDADKQEVVQRQKEIADDPAQKTVEQIIDADKQEVVHTDLNLVSRVDDPASEEIKEEKKAPAQPEIKTENVTLNETDGGYVQYEGKSIQKNALMGMHPELFAAKPDTDQVSTNFGTTFPRFAKKSDMFVRVDVFPNRVYKFDGKRWIEVNKEQSNSYLYNESYINYLVQKIDKGEYDIDLLSDNEKAEIENYLRNNNQ